MHLEVCVAARPPSIDPSVVPNVGSVPAVRAKLHGVHVGIGSDLVNEDKFVLGAVERSHTSIVLIPDTEILELGIDALSGPHDLGEMPPVHADEVNGAINTDLRHIGEDAFQEML